jgi:hypothetical protein
MTSFWRWLGRAYQARLEARKVNATWGELLTAAGTTVVAAQVAKNIQETVDDALTSWQKPHRYYQQYWWLLVDDRDGRAPAAVSRRREPGVWPPFMGHRVPLGGDRA